jgi:diaminopimelate decarboxylase
MTFESGLMHIGGRSVTDLVAEYGSPLYVYDRDIIHGQFQQIRQAISYKPFQLRYACKANGNLAILQLFREWRLHLDVVSPGEVMLAERAGFATHELLYTGNSVTNEELKFAHERGLLINFDSVSQFRRFGEMFPGGMASLRINPDVGAGHHQHVITGGPDSKFGISLSELNEVRELALKNRIRVIGLHQHIGSGILDPDVFWLAMVPILQLAPEFEDLEFINLGGGLGVPYAPEDTPLDVTRLGKGISERFEAFCQSYGRPLRLDLEPGRFLVAPSGYLLVQVNTVKQTDRHIFVGTDSGFNHLIRHPLYKSYHRIVNATREHGPTKTVAVCGNLCESGDLFTHGRDMIEPREGDILAICDAGAYGYSMSFTYNMRPRPAEVMVDRGTTQLIRRRETIDDLMSLLAIQA